MTGILYIVFGEAHDRMAAHCVAYSRKFTKLPIQVLTNLKERNAKWNEVDNIEFTYFDLPTSENRAIKTTANIYSKFDNTIMLDCDSIIKNASFDAEVEKYFSKKGSIILNFLMQYPFNIDGEYKFQKVYLRAYEMFGCKGTMAVYNGAFIGFKRNEISDRFFAVWHKMWKEFGKNREMPVLACATSLMSVLDIAILDNDFFAPDTWEENSVVQHNPNRKEFWDAIGIEPFDLPLTKTENWGDDYSFVDL